MLPWNLWESRNPENCRVVCKVSEYKEGPVQVRDSYRELGCEADVVDGVVHVRQLPDMQTLAVGTRSILDRYFDFGNGRTTYQVFDVGNSGGRLRFFRTLLDMGHDINRAQGYVHSLLLGRNSAGCLYTRNIPGYETDYFLFSNGIDIKTPYKLGEEIVHGEHEVHHRREGGDWSFGKNFGGPAIEFLGFIGSDLMARRTGFETSVSGRFGDREHNEEDLEHWVGYSVAKQFVESGDVPYSELYRAENEGRLWEMVGGVIRPRLDATVPPGFDVDYLARRIGETLKRTSLAADIEITEE